jgi:hypothetical protein
MQQSKKHNLSPHQILDQVYDYDNNVINVRQADVSHELTLSSATDSVMALHPLSTVAQGVVTNCGNYRRCSIFSTGAYTLKVAPRIGDTLVTVSSGASAVSMVIVELCAAQVELIAPAGSYLVLQG